MADRNPRLGGPVRDTGDRWPKVATPRRPTRIQPRVPQGQRPAGRGRRFEPFPTWGYALVAVTVVVVAVALLLLARDQAVPPGTICDGGTLPGARGEGALPSACPWTLAYATPVALGVGGLALLLFVASVTTVVVRGWVPREATTPD